MIEEIAQVAHAAEQATYYSPTKWEDLSPHAREVVAANVEMLLLDGGNLGLHPVFVAVVRTMSVGHPVEELTAA